MLYRTHSLNRELPFGSVLDTNHNFQVTSPALTLLGLATQLAPAQLLMATYELCGTYSTFMPCERTESLLSEALAQRFLSPFDGWRRVIGSSEKPLDLWERSPLLNVEELKKTTLQLEGFHGVKRLRWAASHITGVCASPFEAQVSILLSLPKANGASVLRSQTTGASNYPDKHRLSIRKPAATRIYSSRVQRLVGPSRSNVRGRRFTAEKPHL